MENYDIVIFDCFYEKEHNRKVIQQDFSSVERIDTIQSVIKGTIKAYTCNKLVKKEILAMIEFPQYSRSEDYFITIQNLHNSNKIGYIHEPLYHYQFNDQSLSNDKKRKTIGCIEEKNNWCSILAFLKSQYGSLKIFEPELSKRINKLKIRYLQDKDTRKVKELFSIYPESKFYQYLLYSYFKKAIKMIIPYGLFILYKRFKCKEGTVQ